MGIKESATKVNIDKYLPKTICMLDKGFVFKVSIVPVLYSSEKVRIPIAGIKSRNIIGIYYVK